MQFRPFNRLCAKVGRDHLCAEFDTALCDGATNPLARGRDEDAFVLQIKHDQAICAATRALAGKQAGPIGSNCL